MQLEGLTGRDGGMLAALITILGFLIRLSVRTGRLLEAVDNIRTNHLVHLSDELRDLRHAFTEHLDGRRD